MKIKSIEISNIKGISNHKFDLDLIPNKPNILVAPNGFGKSSFAIAFDSLKRDKIELESKYYYLNNDENRPSLTMAIDDSGTLKVLTANDSENTLNNLFDVFVINSQLFAKATKLNIGGKFIAKPSLEISPIELVSTIPKKTQFTYKADKAKKSFGKNGKILPNICDLLSCSSIMSSIGEDVDFQKFTQVKNKKTLDDVKNEINNLAGNSETIKEWIELNRKNALTSISEFDKLSRLIQKFIGITSEVDSYLASFQIIELSLNMRSDFKKAINYVCYLDDKAYYENTIASFNSTRHTIKPKEDKKKNKLIVEWPKAHEISNGQRDVLSFITLLMRAKRNYRKLNCILVIDEIFDYLDDANLISFQYFITDLIEEMKKENKNFFPILMTHLDPYYFNHFCFNKHRIKVVYLKDMPYSSNPNISKLLRNREDTSIKENLDKYFLHFHPDSIDISTEFSILGLPSSWGKSLRFHEVIDSENTKYLSGQSDYDPLAVCVRIRVRIEELLYSMLTNKEDTEIFINEQHGTKKKLNFCETIGLNIPESYYLLGIIYNDNLHLKTNADIAKPLAIKLENITIKKLISELFK